MKFSQFGRGILAAVALTAMSLTISACSWGHTVAFLYVTSSKVSPGTIYAYKIDGASGTLSLMPDAPFPAGGRNPVAMVTSPNGLFLYVANHDDSTIVENAIGTDGKIYAQCTYNTPSATSFPTAMAIDPGGKFLIVATGYQPGYTDSVPGPGAVVVYPIQPLNATANTSSLCSTGPGTLGTPVVNPGNSASYFPVSGLTPNSITVTAGNFVYVSTSGKSILSPGLTQIVNNTQIFGFSLNTSTGVLTATGTQTYNGSTLDIISSVVPDSSGKYLYATDQYLNVVDLFDINTNGSLTYVTDYTTGNGPNAIAINTFTAPHYLYVANYNDNTISSYSVSSTNGTLTALPVGSSTNSATGSNPDTILIDPVYGYFLYTANFIDGTVSGKQMNIQNGSLINIQFTPFAAGGQPTAMATTTSSAVLQSY